MRAGLPATTAYGGTDSTTTAPAPTIAPRPIVMPGSSVALAPIDAPAFTTVFEKFLRRPLAAREAVVHERRVRPDEDVVLDPHAVPELDAALDGDAIADDHVVLDERVIADVAVGADARAGQHVGEGPDARARSDRLRLAQRLRMQEDRRSSPPRFPRRRSLMMSRPFRT